MKTEIYYFSGTGNSLLVARDIASRSGGKLIPIASFRDKESIETDADVIGIVFPVHCSSINGVPGIVQRFATKLGGMDSKYIFAVCTCGGFSAATIKNLGNIMESNGTTLSAGFSVQMPSNIDAVSQEEQDKLFDEWGNKLDSIYQYVTLQNKGDYETMGLLLKVIMAPIFFYFKSKIIKFLKKYSKSSDLSFDELVAVSDRRFYTDDNCDGCGTCSRVCPVSNIKIEDDRPVWLHHCEMCMACLNWCPNGAIHGEWISKEVRYHNPDVNVADMVDQASFKG